MPGANFPRIRTMNVDPSITLTQAHLLVEAALPPKTTVCIEVQSWRSEDGRRYSKFQVWDGKEQHEGNTLDGAVTACLHHHKNKYAERPSTEALFSEVAHLPVNEAQYPPLKESTEAPLDTIP